MNSGVVQVAINDRIGASIGMLTAETSLSGDTWERVTGFPDGCLAIGTTPLVKAPLYPVGLKRFVRFLYAPEAIYAWGFRFTISLKLQGRHQS